MQHKQTISKKDAKSENSNRFSILQENIDKDEEMKDSENYARNEITHKISSSINGKNKNKDSLSNPPINQIDTAPKSTKCNKLSTEELRMIRSTKKIRKMNPNKYYEVIKTQTKKESEKPLQAEKKPSYWKKMANPQIDDTEMVDAQEQPDEDTNNAILWQKIMKLSDDMQVYVEDLHQHAPRDTLEQALTKLMAKKELDASFGINLNVQNLETPAKRRKTPGSFDKDFILPEEEEEIEQEAKVVTPMAKSDAICEEKNFEDEKNSCDNVRQIIQTITQHLQEPYMPLYDTALKGMNIHQLRKELGKWNVRKRDRKINAEKDNCSINTRGSFMSNPTSAYGASGLNIEAVAKTVERTIPKEVKQNKPPEVEPTVMPQKVAQKNQIRHSYTVRLRLKVTTSNVNVAEKLREMFLLWKSADQSTILLAHADETNSNMMIDDVNKLPHDENEVNKYVMGMYQSYGKLHFSLRMSGHQNLKTLKLKIFQWMRANNGFASIDRVKAALVHTIGFFHSMQPDFYNREMFKTHIKNHLQNINMKDDINVFARKIWMKYKDAKIETRALVLEVPKDQRDIVNEKMMQFEYEKCEEMTYVPFMNMNDEVHQEVMKEILYSQNVYLHKIERRTIYGINDPTKKYTLKNGDEMSFQEWVGTITYEGDTFLEACEIGPTGNLHLIFNEVHEPIVTELFGNDFKELAMKHFQTQDVKDLFQNSKPKVDARRRNTLTEADTNYAAFLKRKFTHNPQDPQTSTTAKITKNKTYAEASREPPIKMNKINLHYSKFSPKVVSTAAHVQINALERVLERVSTLEKSGSNGMMTAERDAWESNLEQRMNEKMNEMQNKFDEKLLNMEQHTIKRMKESENIFMKKFEEIQTNQSEKIEKSFDTKMCEVTSKLDAVMRLMLTNMESTSTETAQNGGGSGTGKSH